MCPVQDFYLSSKLLNHLQKTIKFLNMELYILGSGAQEYLQMTNFYYTLKKSIKKPNKAY